MKVVIPVKEYPRFIECDVYDKDILGNLTFLYHETYIKDYINLDLFKKLLRCNNALNYLENQLELLHFTNGNDELINIVENTINKLTKDEVI